MQEFASLKDDANIYKLVGPVLLKQDKTEAVMAVDGRLECIDKEMRVPGSEVVSSILMGQRKRIEKQIADTQDKSDELRGEVVLTSSSH